MLIFYTRKQHLCKSFCAASKICVKWNWATRNYFSQGIPVILLSSIFLQWWLSCSKSNFLIVTKNSSKLRFFKCKISYQFYVEINFVKDFPLNGNVRFKFFITYCLYNCLNHKEFTSMKFMAWILTLPSFKKNYLKFTNYTHLQLNL